MNRTPPTTSKKKRAARGDERNFDSFAPACVANMTKPTMTIARKMVPLDMGLLLCMKKESCYNVGS
jgi:hypothetical protein